MIKSSFGIIAMSQSRKKKFKKKLSVFCLYKKVFKLKIKEEILLFQLNSIIFKHGLLYVYQISLV